MGHNAGKHTAKGMAENPAFLPDTRIFIDYLRGGASVYAFQNYTVSSG
jgi:hypothetical protein